MCAGDVAFHNLDMVDVALTRTQAKVLRELLEVVATYGEASAAKETAKVILNQLGKAGA